MTLQEEQAALLAAYHDALERDGETLPPPGIDPAIAAIARRLTHHPRPPAPDAAFTRSLQLRLERQQTSNAARFRSQGRSILLRGLPQRYAAVPGNRLLSGPKARHLPILRRSLAMAACLILLVGTVGTLTLLASYWLGNAGVDLDAPHGVAVESSRPTDPSSIDWTSQSAGIFLYQGRGYRLRDRQTAEEMPLRPDRIIGATTLRWQSGGVFPAGTPIHSVIGVSPMQLIAIQVGQQTFFFQADDQATLLFERVRVVMGTVESSGSARCPQATCQGSPEQQARGAISTSSTITVDHILHGRLPAGAREVEIRQIGFPTAALPSDRAVPLITGSTVIIFLQPGQLVSVGDFGYGEYYWAGQGWIYGIENDRIVPLPGGRGFADDQVSVAQFTTSVIEAFEGVQTLDPVGPRPTPLAVPTAPAPVPTVPAVSTSGPVRR